MKMTFETKNMSKETERFNDALDLFFGMNPAKRYWILLALYFAKNKKLKAIDNYEGNDFVMATMSVDLIGHTSIVEEWNQKGVKSRSIVAYVDDAQKDIIDEIYYGFDVDAINYLNNQPNKELGFFGLQQMEPTYLVEAAEILIGLSDDWYNEYSQWAFDLIIRRAQRGDDRSMGMYYQPQELTTLALGLLNAQKGSVYNPYAGICSYGVGLSSNCKYYGQEISVNYVIGKLNLLMNAKCDGTCDMTNSVSEWAGDNDFDYIIATPPFKCRCESPYKFTDLDYLARSSEDASKKAVGIYPQYICFSARNDRNSPVKDIVENDWLEYVIALPKGIFSATSIATIMIVINKHKEKAGYVRFVDASDLFEKDGRTNRLALNEITELVQKSNSDKTIDVCIDTIMDNEYIIAPEYYLSNTDITVPDGFEAHALSEYIKFIPTERYSGDHGRLFSTAKLSADATNGVVHVSDLEVKEIMGSSYKVVDQDCFLLRLWRNIDLFYLLSDDETVVIPSTYNPFVVDESLLNPYYLLGEFHKDYFVSQLERYGKRNGATASSLKREDFLKLMILVPKDFSKQHALALESEESNIGAIVAQKETEYKSKMESFVLNQRQRKHAVAQVLNEILPSMENIESFILNHETVSKDSVVSRRFGTTLETYLSTVRKQLDKVASMVDNFTRQEQYGEPEVIRVEDFLSEYSSTKKALGINVEYKHHYEEEEIEQEVKISKKELTQMLDNLIANAVKYGVTDEIEKKYGSSDEVRKDFQIRIDTFAVHDYKEPVVIKVSNNGEAVSKSISLYKLFTWGIGRGTGIGCWQVKEIAEHFGGSASYEEYPEDPEGFVSEFRIVLPLDED